MKCRTFLGIAALGFMTTVETQSQAQILHDFPGFPTDGSQPYGGVILDPAGMLYGTTQTGGTFGGGIVFKLTPPPPGRGHWPEHVLWNFGASSADGRLPNGDLVQDPAGVIYGMTPSGGAGGFGTVYQLSPPAPGGTNWTETILHAFDFTDGATPLGGLIRDQAGNLYGTTAFGGLSPTSRLGTVFKLAPPAAGQTQWVQQILYSFSEYASDGQNPSGTLVMDAQGNLFGATEYGGSGYGTVFEVSPPVPGQTAWTEKILFAFDGAASGKYPVAGLAVGPRGTLYGTTMSGGSGGLGTVFALAAPESANGRWRYTALHNFTGSPDGATPLSAVTVTRFGTINGTTVLGGSSLCEQGCGTVFELVPPPVPGEMWTEKLYTPLMPSRGSNPGSDVIVGADHALFGTAGGGSPNGGVIYRLPHRELH